MTHAVAFFIESEEQCFPCCVKSNVLLYSASGAYRLFVTSTSAGLQDPGPRPWGRGWCMGLYHQYWIIGLSEYRIIGL